MSNLDAIKGWALVCRDLCEQGADEAKVTLGNTKVRYGDGRAVVKVKGREPVVLTDADLDATGLVVAHDMDPIERAVAAGLIEVESAGVVS